MKIFINQSIFIPWKGFFDNIAAADLYVVYDSVDFNPRSFRNRNKIMTSQGSKFITIPTKKMPRGTSINQIEIADRNWGQACWKTIEHNYKKAPFFNLYKDTFQSLFTETEDRRITNINVKFIRAICALLNINTPITPDTEYDFVGDKSEKLLSICLQSNAETYLSGPGAEDYLNIELFKQNNIAVEFADYEKYPVYTQVYRPFSHHVSILDMLFNLGPSIKQYMLIS